jgi:hypothetical protein
MKIIHPGEQNIPYIVIQSCAYSPPPARCLHLLESEEAVVLSMQKLDLPPQVLFVIVSTRSRRHHPPSFYHPEDLYLDGGLFVYMYVSHRGTMEELIWGKAPNLASREVVKHANNERDKHLWEEVESDLRPNTTVIVRRVLRAGDSYLADWTALWSLF